MKKRTFLLVALFLSAVLLYFSPPRLPLPSIYNFAQLNPDNRIRLFTSFDSYNINDKNITLFTINSAFFKDQYFPDYNTAWRAEVKINGLWCNIPFKKGFVFDNDFYGRFWRERHQYIDLNNLDYNIIEGNYRIIKSIGLRPYAVEFNISKEVPSIQSYYYVALEKLPYFIAKDELIKSGVLLRDHKQTYNIETLQKFIMNVATGKNDLLRTAGYSIEGDLVIQDYIYINESGADKFIYRIDSTRDMFGGRRIDDSISSFLFTDGKRVFLSNNSVYVDSEGNSYNTMFIPSDEAWDGWELIKPIAEYKKANRDKQQAVSYRKWSDTHRRNIFISDIPLEFVYMDIDNNISQKHKLGNKMSLAISIREIIWLNKDTVVFICNTDSDLTYYEIYNVKKQSIEAYTASDKDYHIKYGIVSIDSFRYKYPVN